GCHSRSASGCQATRPGESNGGARGLAAGPPEHEIPQVVPAPRISKTSFATMVPGSRSPRTAREWVLVPGWLHLSQPGRGFTRRSIPFAEGSGVGARPPEPGACRFLSLRFLSFHSFHLTTLAAVAGSPTCPSTRATRSEAATSVDWVTFRELATTLKPRSTNAFTIPAPMP